jgi:hypothetical protein
MYFDNSDPMKASPVSSRFYTRKICQLDKPIRRNSCAETPSFGFTGFEIGKFFAADRVDKKITRLTVQGLLGPGKPTAEFFELSDIHERTDQRLTYRSTSISRFTQRADKTCCRLQHSSTGFELDVDLFRDDAGGLTVRRPSTMSVLGDDDFVAHRQSRLRGVVDAELTLETAEHEFLGVQVREHLGEVGSCEGS